MVGRKYLWAAVASAMLAPGPAWAGEPQTGLYIGLSAGPSYRSSSDVSASDGRSGKLPYSLGYAASGSAGYAFANGFRVETDLTGRFNDTSSDEIPSSFDINRTIVGLMLNLTYDWHNSSDFIPTVGAGIGIAHVDVNDVGTDTVFGYQAILGIGYQVMENVTVFADYRFLGTTELEGNVRGVGVSADNFNHATLIGVRFALGDP